MAACASHSCFCSWRSSFDAIQMTDASVHDSDSSAERKVKPVRCKPRRPTKRTSAAQATQCCWLLLRNPPHVNVPDFAKVVINIILCWVSASFSQSTQTTKRAQRRMRGCRFVGALAAWRGAAPRCIAGRARAGGLLGHAAASSRGQCVLRGVWTREEWTETSAGSGPVMRRRLALALVLVLAAAVAVDPAAVSGKRGKRQRLKNGDRAACACHPVGYLVDAAERACAKHGETDMFELCSAEELAAAGSAEEPEGKPVPPAPPAEATGGDQLLMQATEASKTALYFSVSLSVSLCLSRMRCPPSLCLCLLLSFCLSLPLWVSISIYQMQ